MPEKLRLPFGGAMEDEVDAMAYLKRVNYPWGPGAAVKRKLRLIAWMKAQVGGKNCRGAFGKTAPLLKRRRVGLRAQPG